MGDVPIIRQSKARYKRSFTLTAFNSTNSVPMIRRCKVRYKIGAARYPTAESRNIQCGESRPADLLLSENRNVSRTIPHRNSTFTDGLDLEEAATSEDYIVKERAITVKSSKPPANYTHVKRTEGPNKRISGQKTVEKMNSSKLDDAAVFESEQFRRGAREPSIEPITPHANPTTADVSSSGGSVNLSVDCGHLSSWEKGPQQRSSDIKQEWMESLEDFSPLTIRTAQDGGPNTSTEKINLISVHQPTQDIACGDDYSDATPGEEELNEDITEVAPKSILRDGDDMSKSEAESAETIWCVWPGCSECSNNVKSFEKHLFQHARSRTVQCIAVDCKKEYATSHNLHRHIARHHAGIPYACPRFECAATFSTAKEMVAHAQGHSGLKPFACPIVQCGRQTNSRVSLVVHLLSHLSTPLYKCIENGCNRAFVSRKAMAWHANTHTDKFACSWNGCMVKEYCAARLQNHFRSHAGERPYRCTWDGCGQTYVHKSSLAYHRKKHEGAIQSASGLTSDSALLADPHEALSTTQIQLKDNVKVEPIDRSLGGTNTDWQETESRIAIVEEGPVVKQQSNAGVVRSPTSKEVSETKASHNERKIVKDEIITINNSCALNNGILSGDGHERSVNGLQCPWDGCGTKKPDGEALFRHMYVHVVELPVVCAFDDCGIEFPSHAYLVAHTAGHFRTNSRACAWKDCGFVFVSKRREHCVTHMRTHTREAAFSCPWADCDYVATVRQVIVKHMMKHHSGLLPFACEEVDCNKRYATKYILDRHSISHTDRFACVWEGCGRRMESAEKLHRHMMSHAGKGVLERIRS